MPTNTHEKTIAELRAHFGDRISTGESVLALHSRDEAYTPPVLPDAAVFPNTEEVVRVVKTCAANGCPIVPFNWTSLEGTCPYPRR